MLDAADIVAATGPLPDIETADLLGSALAGVRDLADRSEQAPAGHISVARRILAVERDLACLIRRLRQLRA